MNIVESTIERISLAFPAEFKAKTIDDEDVFISYRYGRIKIHLDGDLKITTSQDAYDIGGSISDKELLVVLEREGLLHKEDQTEC